jgi:hypothetical protein
LGRAALLFALLASLDSFVDDLSEGFEGMISGQGAPLGVGAVVTAGAMFLEPSGSMEGFMGAGMVDEASAACDHLFGLGSVALASTAWASGALFDEEGLENTGMRCTEALALSLALAGLLKVTTGRERPDGSDRLSFPSFHSASSGAIAAVIWQEHGPGAGIPLALLASFTALSRVHLGEHYISDATAGLAIGAAAGLAISSLDGGEGGGPSPVFGLSFSGDGVTPVLEAWGHGHFAGWDVER